MTPLPRAASRDDLSPAELAGEIAARLRPVVPHMDTGEFDALVRRIAAVEVKYRVPATPPRSIPAVTGAPDRA